MRRMQDNASFKAKYNGLNIRIFLLLDWFPQLVYSTIYP